MITKKLGKITFGWDPTAYKGKGYWYVVGKNDSFSRAASRSESQKLGRPKEAEQPPKDVEKKNYYYDVGKHGKPVRKQIYTGSKYEEAEITTRKGLMQLASERMMGGQSLGSSISGAISDKWDARKTNLKRKIDPMNLLSKIPGVGKLAATAYGKKFGRSASDISYFTGVHAPEPINQEEPTAKKETGIFSPKLSEEDKSEADARYQKEQEDIERRHKELIDAILLGKKPGDKKDAGIGLFGSLIDSIKGMLSSIVPKLGALLTGLSSFVSAALPLLGTLAMGAAIPSLLAFLTKQAEEADLNDRTGFNIFTKTAQLGLTSFGNEDPALKRAQEQYDTYVADVKAGKAAIKDVTDPTLNQWRKLGINIDPNVVSGGDLSKVELTESQKIAGEKSEKFRQNIDKKIAEEKETASKIKPEEEIIKLEKSKSEIIKLKNNTKDQNAIKAYDNAISNIERDITKYKEMSKTKSVTTETNTSTVIPETALPETSISQQSTPAVPMVTPVDVPKTLDTRAVIATLENKNLADNASNIVNPVVINKNTNVVNNGGMSAIGGQGGRIRNDDSILLTVQYQNVRPV